MSRNRKPAPAVRRACLDDGPIRLDLTVNPYGPSLSVQEALAAAPALHLPADDREALLRQRIASALNVPPDRVLLANGIAELLTMLLMWRRAAGPLVTFPPSDARPVTLARQLGIEVVEVYRAPDFSLSLDPGTLSDVPMGATAYIQSPNDPSGTLLQTQDAVRVTRACEIVLIDERHGAYNPRSLLPLAREFDNVVILRTMETWAGLTGFPVAYAIAPARLIREIAEFRIARAVALGAVIAGLATFQDLREVEHTLLRVRSERGRLYRTLRKLNMVSVPLPSWANFLLVQAERTDAGTLAQGLAERNILVHRPEHEAIRDRYLRISATFPEETEKLKDALIEIGIDL